MEGCTETVAHIDRIFALSISISIICIIYVSTEQTAVLRKRNAFFWFLLYFLVDQGGNSVEGNRELSIHISTVRISHSFCGRMAHWVKILILTKLRHSANTFVFFLQSHSEPQVSLPMGAVPLSPLTFSSPSQTSEQNLPSRIFLCDRKNWDRQHRTARKKSRKNFKWSEMNLWAAGQHSQRDAVIAHRVWKWTGQ